MADQDVSARLANLLAVTDARLTSLAEDDLLGEVLERLRGILDADTAAVLLHDEGTHDLVARAARGLEEEVRQGVRVPIGTGFAGRIAALRQPVRLYRVDETTVANPILWEKGIQRMLGVPLVARDILLGVLHVGRLAPRDFTNDDEELLQIAAERIAAAVQSRRYAVEAAAAGLLERGLLPARLPRVAGLQFAARYVPAESQAIGGDWYDAFLLPDGALWVVTGDVAGHGLTAAVVMGRIKSALRAYALLGEGPARVLELTDRKVEHFEIGAMVTVVCARSYPPYDTWTVSSAGHLPPVLAGPGMATSLLTVPPGPPLGTLAAPGPRNEVQVQVPDGGLLVFYTDGLVERRDDTIDEGLERLRRSVYVANPDTVCRDVMHQLVGADTPMDDIAVLAVRRGLSSDPNGSAASTAPRVHEIVPDSQGPRIARRIAVESAGPLPADVRDTLELLVSEIATNAIMHGDTSYLALSVTRRDEDVLVEMFDAGADGVIVRHPGIADAHGRGLNIVAQIADEWGVWPARPGPGKTVWFRLNVASPAGSANARSQAHLGSSS